MPDTQDLLHTIIAKLDEGAQREQVMVETMGVMVGVVEMTNELVVDLLAFVKAPPKSDLAATLRAMGEAIRAQTGVIVGLGGRIDKIPEELATILGDYLKGE